MSLVELGVVVWAAAAAGFSWVALWRLRQRPARPAVGAWPAVLLLRPMDAPSEAELEALAVPVGYSGALTQVVLCPVSPALPPPVRWLPSDPISSNRKVGHLVYGAAVLGAGDPVVVAVDADVRVDRTLLEALVAPLVAGADLSWAAPHPEVARTVWGRAVRGLLGRGHHAFDTLAAMSAGSPTVCGKAVGLGPRALALLPQLSHCIGEDLELSTRLSARGGRVVLAAAPARVLSERGSPAATVDRFTRWMQVLKAHRPALYPSIPSLLAPTLPLLLAAALVSSFWTWGAVAVLVATRVALSLRLAQRAGSGFAGAGWEWLLGEALLLVSFARSLGRRTVAWRGRRFRLEAKGRMRELFPPVPRWSAP